MAEKMDWFPFHADKFLASRKVRLMSHANVGIYILLLAETWSHGPLPKNMAEIGELVGLDEAAMTEAWKQVGRAFKETPTGYVNERLEEIRKEQQTRRERYVRAGRKGAESRWSQEDNGDANGDANATAMAVRSRSREESKNSTPPTPPRGAYEEEFEKLWNAYPNRPNQSKRKAHRAWRARVREGAPPADLLAGVLRYKQRCAVEKTEPRFIKHCATFLGPDGFWKLDHKPERDPRKDYNPTAAVEAKEAEARRAAETRQREAETAQDTNRVQQWIATHKAEHQMLRNKLAVERGIDMEDTAGRALLLAAVTTEIQRILEDAA